MRTAWIVVGLCCFPLSPVLAEEQPVVAATTTANKPLGLEFSLRLGPAVGSLSVLNQPLFDLWLGLGYRIGGVWYVGISGVYGLGSVPSEGGGTDRRVSNAQFLVEAVWHPLAYGKIDPWLGYGIGGEWFNGGAGGFVPVNFEMGVDFALSQSVRVGPFFAVQVAFSGNDTHNWYIVGLKLTALP